jgi:dihydroflavonol-4-reductase
MSSSQKWLVSGARVLVTGATGMVGNNVTRLLQQWPVLVRLLARKQSDRRPLEGLEAEIVEGDVTDPGSLEAALRGVDAVVHSAGCVLLGWKNVPLHEAINHQGTRHVAAAARAARARMVYVSTNNTLGVGRKDRPASEQWAAGQNIDCPYVVSKKAAEAAVRQEIESGLDAVIVHPGLMFGPWDWKPSSGRMILEVARSFTPMAPTGGCSVCDVRDVARGILAALEQAPSGRDYVLAGHNLTYLKLWQLIADVAGGSRPFCRSGPLIRIALGRGGDLWGWLSGHEPDVNSAAIKLSDCYHYFDSSRAQQELGYQVRPVQESLRDAWQWFQDYGYVRR